MNLTENIKEWFHLPTETHIESMVRRISQLEHELDSVKTSLAAVKRARKGLLGHNSRLNNDLRTASAFSKKEIATSKSERDLAKEKFEDLVSRYSELCDGYNKLAPDSTELKRSLSALEAEHEQLQLKYQGAQHAVQNAEGEAGQARTQLTRFKSNLSTANKLKPQITDSDIRARVDQIFYLLQDFAITACRVAKFEACNLSRVQLRGLDHIIQDAEALPKALTPHIITTLVGTLLIQRFAPAYYFGLSPETVISEVAQLVASTHDTNPIETKAWLEPTRKMLSLTKAQELRESDERFFQNTLDDLMQFLGELFDDKSAPKAEASLRKIITTAFDLFKLLHESKALFKIDFLGTNLVSEENKFRSGTMQAIASDEEETALVRRPLQMLVFPGVFKFGNELGNNQEEMTVICKARVVPQKESRPTGSRQ
ncbi:hypothetical protein LTR22_027180 [Elasticomyces elasticus]|nr:hypothetical protein LTR22_027180 [Elasticomyces elasticus]